MYSRSDRLHLESPGRLHWQSGHFRPVAFSTWTFPAGCVLNMDISGRLHLDISGRLCFQHSSFRPVAVSAWTFLAGCVLNVVISGRLCFQHGHFRLGTVCLATFCQSGLGLQAAMRQETHVRLVSLGHIRPVAVATGAFVAGCVWTFPAGCGFHMDISGRLRFQHGHFRPVAFSTWTFPARHTVPSHILPFKPGAPASCG